MEAGSDRPQAGVGVLMLKGLLKSPSSASSPKNVPSFLKVSSPNAAIPQLQEISESKSFQRQNSGSGFFLPPKRPLQPSTLPEPVAPLPPPLPPSPSSTLSTPNAKEAAVNRLVNLFRKPQQNEASAQQAPPPPPLSIVQPPQIQIPPPQSPSSDPLLIQSPQNVSLQRKFIPRALPKLPSQLSSPTPSHPSAPVFEPPSPEPEPPLPPPLSASQQVVSQSIVLPASSPLGNLKSIANARKFFQQTRNGDESVAHQDEPEPGIDKKNPSRPIDKLFGINNQQAQEKQVETPPQPEKKDDPSIFSYLSDLQSKQDELRAQNEAKLMAAMQQQQQQIQQQQQQLFEQQQQQLLQHQQAQVPSPSPSIPASIPPLARTLRALHLENQLNHLNQSASPGSATSPEVSVFQPVPASILPPAPTVSPPPPLPSSPIPSSSFNLLSLAQHQQQQQQSYYDDEPESVFTTCWTKIKAPFRRKPLRDSNSFFSSSSSSPDAFFFNGKSSAPEIATATSLGLPPAAVYHAPPPSSIYKNPILWISLIFALVGAITCSFSIYFLFMVKNIFSQIESRYNIHVSSDGSMVGLQQQVWTTAGQTGIGLPASIRPSAMLDLSSTSSSSASAPLLRLSALSSSIAALPSSTATPFLDLSIQTSNNGFAQKAGIALDSSSFALLIQAPQGLTLDSDSLLIGKSASSQTRIFGSTTIDLKLSSAALNVSSRADIASLYVSKTLALSESASFQIPALNVTTGGAMIVGNVTATGHGSFQHGLESSNGLFSVSDGSSQISLNSGNGVSISSSSGVKLSDSSNNANISIPGTYSALEIASSANNDIAISPGGKLIVAKNAATFSSSSIAISAPMTVSSPLTLAGGLNILPNGSTTINNGLYAFGGSAFAGGVASDSLLVSSSTSLLGSFTASSGSNTISNSLATGILLNGAIQLDDLNGELLSINSTFGTLITASPARPLILRDSSNSTASVTILPFSSSTSIGLQLSTFSQKDLSIQSSRHLLLGSSMNISSTADVLVSAPLYMSGTNSNGFAAVVNGGRLNVASGLNVTAGGAAVDTLTVIGTSTFQSIASLLQGADTTILKDSSNNANITFPGPHASLELASAAGNDIAINPGRSLLMAGNAINASSAAIEVNVPITMNAMLTVAGGLSSPALALSLGTVTTTNGALMQGGALVLDDLSGEALFLNTASGTLLTSSSSRPLTIRDNSNSIGSINILPSASSSTGIQMSTYNSKDISIQSDRHILLGQHVNISSASTGAFFSAPVYFNSAPDSAGFSVAVNGGRLKASLGLNITAGGASIADSLTVTSGGAVITGGVVIDSVIRDASSNANISFPGVHAALELSTASQQDIAINPGRFLLMSNNAINASSSSVAFNVPINFNGLVTINGGLSSPSLALSLGFVTSTGGGSLSGGPILLDDGAGDSLSINTTVGVLLTSSSTRALTIRDFDSNSGSMVIPSFSSGTVGLQLTTYSSKDISIQSSRHILLGSSLNISAASSAIISSAPLYLNGQESSSGFSLLINGGRLKASMGLNVTSGGASVLGGFSVQGDSILTGSATVSGGLSSDSLIVSTSSSLSGTVSIVSGSSSLNMYPSSGVSIISDSAMLLSIRDSSNNANITLPGIHAALELSSSPQNDIAINPGRFLLIANNAINASSSSIAVNAPITFNGLLTIAGGLNSPSLALSLGTISASNGGSILGGSITLDDLNGESLFLNTSSGTLLTAASSRSLTIRDSGSNTGSFSILPYASSTTGVLISSFSSKDISIQSARHILLGSSLNISSSSGAIFSTPMYLNGQDASGYAAVVNGGRLKAALGLNVTAGGASISQSLTVSGGSNLSGGATITGGSSIDALSVSTSSTLLGSLSVTTGSSTLSMLSTTGISLISDASQQLLLRDSSNNANVSFPGTHAALELASASQQDIAINPGRFLLMANNAINASSSFIDINVPINFNSLLTISGGLNSPSLALSLGFVSSTGGGSLLGGAVRLDDFAGESLSLNSTIGTLLTSSPARSIVLRDNSNSIGSFSILGSSAASTTGIQLTTFNQKDISIQSARHILLGSSVNISSTSGILLSTPLYVTAQDTSGYAASINGGRLLVSQGLNITSGGASIAQSLTVSGGSTLQGGSVLLGSASVAGGLNTDTLAVSTTSSLIGTLSVTSGSSSLSMASTTGIALVSDVTKVMTLRDSSNNANITFPGVHAALELATLPSNDIAIYPGRNLLLANNAIIANSSSVSVNVPISFNGLVTINNGLSSPSLALTLGSIATSNGAAILGGSSSIDDLNGEALFLNTTSGTLLTSSSSRSLIIRDQSSSIGSISIPSLASSSLGLRLQSFSSKDISLVSARHILLGSFFNLTSSSGLLQSTPLYLSAQDSSGYAAVISGGRLIASNGLNVTASGASIKGGLVVTAGISTDTLSVSSTSQFLSWVNMTSALEVYNTAFLRGGANVTTALFVNGFVIISDTLSVGSNTRVSGSLFVSNGFQSRSSALLAGGASVWNGLYTDILAVNTSATLTGTMSLTGTLSVISGSNSLSMLPAGGVSLVSSVSSSMTLRDSSNTANMTIPGRSGAALELSSSSGQDIAITPGRNLLIANSALLVNTTTVQINQPLIITSSMTTASIKCNGNMSAAYVESLMGASISGGSIVLTDSVSESLLLDPAVGTLLQSHSSRNLVIRDSATSIGSVTIPASTTNGVEIASYNSKDVSISSSRHIILGTKVSITASAGVIVTTPTYVTASDASGYAMVVSSGRLSAAGLNITSGANIAGGTLISNGLLTDTMLVTSTSSFQGMITSAGGISITSGTLTAAGGATITSGLSVDRMTVSTTAFIANSTAVNINVPVNMYSGLTVWSGSINLLGAVAISSLSVSTLNVASAATMSSLTINNNVTAASGYLQSRALSITGSNSAISTFDAGTYIFAAPTSVSFLGAVSLPPLSSTTSISSFAKTVPAATGTGTTGFGYPFTGQTTMSLTFNVLRVSPTFSVVSNQNGAWSLALPTAGAGIALPSTIPAGWTINGISARVLSNVGCGTNSTNLVSASFYALDSTGATLQIISANSTTSAGVGAGTFLSSFAYAPQTPAKDWAQYKAVFNFQAASPTGGTGCNIVFDLALLYPSFGPYSP